MDVPESKTWFIFFHVSNKLHTILKEKQKFFDVISKPFAFDNLTITI